MKAHEQPENDSGRLRRHPERHREKEISNQTLPDRSPTVKKLLEHRHGVWLLEVSEGRRVHYVEYNSEYWRFALRFQAESKFERLLAKIGGGAG